MLHCVSLPPVELNGKTNWCTDLAFGPVNYIFIVMNTLGNV